MNVGVLAKEFQRSNMERAYLLCIGDLSRAKGKSPVISRNFDFPLALFSASSKTIFGIG